MRMYYDINFVIATANTMQRILTCIQLVINSVLNINIVC